MNIGIAGAGIFGMAAALELRRRGHRVTLIERGEIPNPEASSTDVAKVIRRTSYPNEVYVELVTRSAAQWREWHERTSRSIYFRTGKLIAVRGLGPDHEALAGLETLSRMGEDISELTAKEVNERFPQFAVRSEDRLFFDPWAGYLRSGQALVDLAALARGAGVDIRENTPVTAVEDSGSGARLRLGPESLKCDRAVVAAGPWVAQLLPVIATRVRLTRQQMAFFAPQDPSPFERGRFPVWTSLSPGNLWYGFPLLHEGYVKVAEDSKVDDYYGGCLAPADPGVSGLGARGRRRPHPGTRRRRGGRRPLLPIHQHGRQGGRAVRHRLGSRVPAGPDRRLRLRPRLQVRRIHRTGDRRCP